MVMKQIKCILNLILSRSFNLINSPLQFMCFIEYLKKNKDNFKDNNIIYVGYCSNLSKKQIKNINTNIYKTHLEIFFLDEVFNVRVFHFILFFLKRLKRKFLICVSGTYDYYLFKEFIKKSEKVVLLDEGISLLSTRNHEALKKYNTTLFSCFPIKNKYFEVFENKFSYLKTYIRKDYKIDNDLAYCIGSDYFENEIRKGGLEKHLNDLENQYKDKKIYYFPHRAEKINNNLLKNFNIKLIDIPIELFILQESILPKTICGFYSTALFTLHILLENKNIDIVNINFDFNLYKWTDFPDFDKNIAIDKLLSESGIKNFY